MAAERWGIPMRKKRKELSIGFIFYAVYLILNQFFIDFVPQVVLGFMFGLGLCFLIVGILPDKIYNNIKGFKKRLIGK
jgi:hypothetical protein